MPVLDALQQGIPVLTSRRGSLPEVVGTAAVFVDPEDVASITTGLETLLRDDALRARLREEGPAQAAKFSWKRTVDLFLDALQPLL
jgi:glycosyltransferase involved in cell wall biosynthesis